MVGASPVSLASLDNYWAGTSTGLPLYPTFRRQTMHQPRFRDLLLFAVVVAPVVVYLLLGASGFFEALP